MEKESYAQQWDVTGCLCRQRVSSAYLSAHAGVYGVSVPGAALGQRQRAAPQLGHELAHLHDGDGVERARQARQVLHVVHPVRIYFVNTPQ